MRGCGRRIDEERMAFISHYTLVGGERESEIRRKGERGGQGERADAKYYPWPTLQQGLWWSLHATTHALQVAAHEKRQPGMGGLCKNAPEFKKLREDKQKCARARARARVEEEDGSGAEVQTETGRGWQTPV